MNKAKASAALTDAITALNAIARALGDLTTAINEEPAETKTTTKKK